MLTYKIHLAAIQLFVSLKFDGTKAPDLCKLPCRLHGAQMTSLSISRYVARGAFVPLSVMCRLKRLRSCQALPTEPSAPTVAD